MTNRKTGQATVKVSEALSNFIYNSAFPVDLKDCSGKYKENNALAAVVSGLEPKERIGLSIYDIAQINHMPEMVVQKIVEADQNVHPDCAPVQLTHTFLDTQSHCVVVDQVIKQAVVNEHNHMVGVLSFAKNKTASIDRMKLYHLYKSYYPVEEAIPYFLKYLNTMSFFTHMPNDLELNTLLLGRLPTEKIAQYLQLSIETVRSTQKSVQEKLIMIDCQVLSQLLSMPHLFQAND